jgi:hypothetical protein
MSATYIVEPIGQKTIDRAYPLVKPVMPRMLLHEWRQFCHSLELSRAPPIAAEREEVIIARNADNYVKGLCVYVVRDHTTYGRLIDVPFFVAASAADGEGVTLDLLDYLRAKCDSDICSGIRFWKVGPETWAHRLKPDHVARSDHGLFMPALASAAEIENALLAHGLGAAEAIDRFSR